MFYVLCVAVREKIPETPKGNVDIATEKGTWNVELAAETAKIRSITKGVA